MALQNQLLVVVVIIDDSQVGTRIEYEASFIRTEVYDWHAAIIAE